MKGYDEKNYDTEEIALERRSFLRMGLGGLATLLTGGAVSSCLLDTRGLGRFDGEARVGQADAGTDPNPDIDPNQSDGGITDGGTDGDAGCEAFDPHSPVKVFKSMGFDPEMDSLDDHIAAQILPEGSVTVGDVIGYASSNRTSYSTERFWSYAQLHPELIDYMAEDLAGRVLEVKCIEEPTAADYDRAKDDAKNMIEQMFNHSDAREDFRLRPGGNAVYFARIEGADGIERTYVLLKGANAPSGSDQEMQALVLWYTPMDNSMERLEELNAE